MAQLIAYSKIQRVVDALCIAILMLGIVLMMVKLNAYNPGLIIFWLLPLQFFIAALAADFFSGLAHFLGDNPISQNPWLAKWFYRGFYNHHIEPTEMTRHDFVETNGLNAAGASIILFPSLYFLPQPHDLLSTSLCIFALFLSFMVFMTNQIHKWSHTNNPPGFVSVLQKHNLILNPRNHIKHHLKHDRYYCITTGWLNALFFKIQFWEKMTGLGVGDKD